MGFRGDMRRGYMGPANTRVSLWNAVVEERDPRPYMVKQVRSRRNLPSPFSEFDFFLLWTPIMKK